MQKQLRRTEAHPSDTMASTVPLVSKAMDPLAFVSKEAVIAALRKDVEWLKVAEVIPESFDVSSLAGHSFRRSGAKDYARPAVPMDLKYVARHSSDATQEYVEEALVHDRLREHMSLQEQISTARAMFKFRAAAEATD